MTTPTADHGEVVHLAGRMHLSPALDEAGAPAFSAAAGDGLRRCGWAGFFAAMEARSLAVGRLGRRRPPGARPVRARTGARPRPGPVPLPRPALLLRPARPGALTAGRPSRRRPLPRQPRRSEGALDDRCQRRCLRPWAGLGAFRPGFARFPAWRPAPSRGAARPGRPPARGRRPWPPSRPWPAPDGEAASPGAGRRARRRAAAGAASRPAKPPPPARGRSGAGWGWPWSPPRAGDRPPGRRGQCAAAPARAGRGRARTPRRAPPPSPGPPPARAGPPRRARTPPRWPPRHRRPARPCPA